MKKKFVSIVMAGLMLALTGCGGGNSGAGTEASTTQADSSEAGTTEEAAASGEAAVSGENLEERTTLTVGFDASFPPYGYLDANGEYIGFDLDLAQEVCDRNGWELIKQPIDWAVKDMELSSGTIDCIWNGFTINGREDDYTWSIPYVNNKQVIVVLADSGISTMEDLAGKTVGVQQDSSALAALEEAPGSDLAATFAGMEKYAEYNTAFIELEAGAIDALAVDIGVASYQIASRGDNFVILEEELASEQYGIGFLLGNETLKDAVETTLLEMVEDGTFAEIVEKYADYGMAGLVSLE